MELYIGPSESSLINIITTAPTCYDKLVLNPEGIVIELPRELSLIQENETTQIKDFSSNFEDVLKNGTWNQLGEIFKSDKFRDLIIYKGQLPLWAIYSSISEFGNIDAIDSVIKHMVIRKWIEDENHIPSVKMMERVISSKKTKDISLSSLRGFVEVLKTHGVRVNEDENIRTEDILRNLSDESITALTDEIYQKISANPINYNCIIDESLEKFPKDGAIRASVRQIILRDERFKKFNSSETAEIDTDDMKLRRRINELIRKNNNLDPINLLMTMRKNLAGKSVDLHTLTIWVKMLMVNGVSKFGSLTVNEVIKNLSPEKYEAIKGLIEFYNDLIDGVTATKDIKLKLDGIMANQGITRSGGIRDAYINILLSDKDLIEPLRLSVFVKEII